MNDSKLALSPTGGSLVAPPAQFRTLLVSLLAGAIGVLAGGIAYILYDLIGFFTNLFFYHKLAVDFTSVRLNHLGPWVIVTPVVGGLIVGFMAKYGSEKIKGHGIPKRWRRSCSIAAGLRLVSPSSSLCRPLSQSEREDRSARKGQLFKPEARSVRW